MREGALYQRELPDGRELVVYPMLFNDRIVVGLPDAPTYDDGWCMVKGTAVDVAATWDGEGDPPGPWIKHLGSGRIGPGMEEL